MIVELLVLGAVGATSYYGYTKVIADKLDCPANNQAVKGLEKQEIKEAIKDGDDKVKVLKEEIKKIEKGRKDILAGSESDKGEKAQEKLDAKNEKIKELEELENNLNDLKVVDKGEWGGWKAVFPNKLTFNNGLWIGGFLLAIGITYKFCIGIFKSISRSIWPAE